MSHIVLQDIFYIAVLVGLSVPLGIYIYKVMTGQRVFLTPALAPVEKGIYKLMGIDVEDEMNAGKYALSVFLFSGAGFVFLFGLLML